MSFLSPGISEAEVGEGNEHIGAELIGYHGWLAEHIPHKYFQGNQNHHTRHQPPGEVATQINDSLDNETDSFHRLQNVGPETRYFLSIILAPPAYSEAMDSTSLPYGPARSSHLSMTGLTSSLALLTSA